MPSIDETTQFICLSDKPFINREYSYTGALGLKPKNGMWFSFPSKANGMVSGWHEFLCERAPDLISRFCNEDGATNVISAKLKDTIIVTTSELIDVFKEAKKNIWYDSEDAEKRKCLLETVKTRFNISNANHLILDVDDGGFESVFELFYSDFLKNPDPCSVLPKFILKKVQEEGLQYYLNPYSTKTGKEQLNEYEKSAKLITECLCGSNNLEESEVWYADVYRLSCIFNATNEIKRGRDISRLHLGPTSYLQYINLKKYSSKESIMQILEHVDASQEEKEKLLSKYDTAHSKESIFDDQTFWSLLKDELFKDYAEFADNIMKNNIYLPNLSFIEATWFKKLHYPSIVNGTEFFNILVEQEKYYEQNNMQHFIYGIPSDITSFFSGMINRSYVDHGLDIPSLVVFDTDCLNVVEQKEQVLFSREQLIDGITQNVKTLATIDISKASRDIEAAKDDNIDI